jgi:hypothetical protein
MSEQRLRTALRELGDVPAPADLAGGALARARRDRRRHRGGLAALAAAAAIVAVAVPLAGLDRPEPAQPAGPPPRLVVTGYASRDPAVPNLGAGTYHLYDRSAAGYAPGRWTAAVPSPDGRLVAVVSGTGRVGLVAADRVGDPDAVRWTPTTAPGRQVVWAPDGRRLFVAGVTRIEVQAGRVTTTGAVIDARTAGEQTVRLRWAQRGTITGHVVFGPRGAGWAVGPALIRLPEASDPLLRLFDGQGRLVRTVPVGVGWLPDQPFSPDSRLVAVAEGGSTRVLDLASGTDAGVVEGRAAGWDGSDRLVVLVGRSVRVVEVRSGRVVAEREVAAPGRVLSEVWLAPLDGVPPPGAIVL